VWVPALAECAVVLANNGLLPDGWNEEVLRALTGSPFRTIIGHTLPPVLLGAAALAVVGTSIRTAAYAALGNQFTYHLALRDDYVLVTKFPYTVVRHPSYLGYFATLAGAALMLVPRDGWARAVFAPWVASAPHTPGKLAAGAAAAGVVTANALMVLAFRARVNVEDEMMRDQFGQQWDKWAKKVPNQIIPYVW
jgi:protein-S-isoprenylcysteine O-methyltransferase Ste14